MKLMTPIKSLLLVLLLVLSAANGNAAPVGTGFLYQGLLTVDGRPASGSYDMIFTLFRQGEPAPGTALTIPNVSVMLGVFTVKLDYGQGPFDGAAAYELGIAVRESAGGGDFSTLGPRQPLTPTPFALSADGQFRPGFSLEQQRAFVERKSDVQFRNQRDDAACGGCQRSRCVEIRPHGRLHNRR